MIKEFKEFILRGNVIDLAVGVVIGSAFTAIVNSIVTGFVTPLVTLVIKLITGSKNAEFKELNLTVNGITLSFGSIISAIITFLITALVVFLIVKAVNRAQTFRKKPEEAAETESQPTTEEYLKEIRDLLAAKNEEKQKKERP